MGISFGQPTEDPPPYHALRYVPYEVRLYEQCFVAETTAVNLSSAFDTLANYVGAFGTPENSKKQPIEVVVSLEGVPVSSESRISSIIAPLLTYNNTMQFILFPKYKKLSEVPFPTNPHVKIRQIPKRAVAVTPYYGWVSPSLSQQKYDWLCRALRNDRLMTQPSQRIRTVAVEESLRSDSSTEAMDAVDRDVTPTLTSPYCVAQYHPPYSLPCCRQVEVWVPLDPTSARLQEMIRGYYDYNYSVRKSMDTLMDANYQDDPFDQEYDSEDVGDADEELEVSTSETIKRGAKKVVHYAEKFLNRNSA